MRSDDREYVLKKRDPSQWSSGLLQCNSSSALSALRSSSTTCSHTSLVSLHFSQHVEVLLKINWI